MKSGVSLCLLLWRQLVNLWRNRRGHEEACCYYISCYCTVQNPIITENGKCVIYHLTWPWHYLCAVSCLAVVQASYKFPNAKVKSCTEMGNKIKIGPGPEIPSSPISNKFANQFTLAGLNFDQDSRSSPAYILYRLSFTNAQAAEAEVAA
ncbi:unnamed protein product [Urochloa decumbens]|uniref:Uncharacterized protein n=1 Tax=Urochloa decumbens TaxID=240449 RepID=A0ABC9GNW2_9POAL